MADPASIVKAEEIRAVGESAYLVSEELLTGHGDVHLATKEGRSIYLGQTVDGDTIDGGQLTEQPDAWLVLRRAGTAGITDDEAADYIVPAWRRP